MTAAVAESAAKQEILLADYSPPKFSIDDVSLTFQLHTDHAIIIAESHFRRNGKHSEPLALDGGPFMTLESVYLNGEPLVDTSYVVDTQLLTIPNLPDEFTLTVTTRTNPHENTRLEGLYHSGGNFCTQCEAQGFRHITYYLDRPDVLARYRVRIEADKEKFPILLSNGNKAGDGDLAGGRHYAEWVDPHPKPSYLFALVAGDLACNSDTFKTASGRDVTLNIYVAAPDIDKTEYAMGALKRSMVWDEQVFGLEYDLDIYNIVAVSDFNMGAMENKGLNVFNTKYVLASPDTATDTDFSHVEGVIGHEYFHNWTGNRVTCRDWFQLSLKEGLTVFRDQEFSSDMGSRALKRIDDVRSLRVLQFSEDAGPLAHPVRPEKYIEINNFYTATVYNKGAEVIRMMHSFLGAAAFRKGMDLYFERYDGQAVTCEDFVRSMEDASGVDLQQFRLWYSQAGTPTLTIKRNRQGSDIQLIVEQSCSATPGQEAKQPFFMPLFVGWIDKGGVGLMPAVDKGGEWRGDTCVLTVNSKKQTFTFRDVPEGAVVSLLRQFSAPVKLEHDLSDEELAFLMQYDSDTFSRWEAAQNLAAREVLAAVERDDAVQGLSVYGKVFSEALKDRKADPALIAELITLPSEIELGQKMMPLQPAKLHNAREALISRLACQNIELLLSRFQELSGGSYDLSPVGKAKRRLKNILLGYIATVPGKEELLLQHYQVADNMTDRMAALQLIVHGDFDYRDAVLEDFYASWKHNALVLDKWFAVQAQSKHSDAISSVRALTKHEAFSYTNPNRLRSLVSCFSMLNQVGFHTTGGDGYRFLAEMIIEVDKVNPQIAAKLVAPLGRYARLNSEAASQMKESLRWVVKENNVSDDVCELCEKSLA